MQLLFYNLFLKIYSAAIYLLAFFNNKAKNWVNGRISTMDEVRSTMEKIKDSTVIWMHCASLGEFEQGRPLIEALKNNNPTFKIILTFFSPSGYEACKNYAGADAIFYLPMDSKKNAQKFIELVKPNLVIWVKYEYWFYYLNELKKQNIPVVLASAIFRKSQPFFKWYGKFWINILQTFTYIFVQDEKSKNNLATINFIDNVFVSGDTRFDRVEAIANKFEPLPLIENFCGNSKVFVAGSTWEDDEEELIHYVKTHPQIKFIIAPHEVDEENIKDVQRKFVGAKLYSKLTTDNGQQTTNCLIIDNIGMLSRLYKYATVTYIGGGFGKDGVHNVLEAAVYGKPVIFGPVYDKFKEAIDLVDCEGAVVINNALELEKLANNLFEDENLQQKMSAASYKYVHENTGATKIIIDAIYKKRLLIN